MPQNFLFDRRIPITVEELAGLGWDKLGFQLTWANRCQRRHAVRDAVAKVDALHLKHQLVSGLGLESPGYQAFQPSFFIGLSHATPHSHLHPALHI